MATVASIFDALKGPAAVGRAIGVSTEHAAAMRRRGSIPVDYWSALLREGAKQFPPTVTHQELIDAHAERRRRRAQIASSEARA